MASKKTSRNDGSNDRKRKTQKVKYYECPECSANFPLPFGEPLLPRHRWRDSICQGSGKNGI